MGEYVEPVALVDPARTPIAEAIGRYYNFLITGRTGPGGMHPAYMQDILKPLLPYPDQGVADMNPLYLLAALQSVEGSQESGGVRDALLRRFGDNENLQGWSPFKGRGGGKDGGGGKIPIAAGPFQDNRVSDGNRNLPFRQGPYQDNRVSDSGFGGGNKPPSTRSSGGSSS